MAQISLQKLLHRAEIAPVVRGIVVALGSRILIEDLKGKMLLSSDGDAEAVSRHPVLCAQETIGWVSGDGKAHSVAVLLSHLAEREHERKALVQETLNKYKEISLLYGVAEKIASCLDLREAARLAVEEAKKVIRADNVSVQLLSELSGKLETIYASGAGAGLDVEEPGSGIAGAVLATGRAEIVNDVTSDPRYVERAVPISSLLCAPLQTKGRVIGLMNMSSDQPLVYTAEDLKLLVALSSQAAVAIENARLYDSLKETFLTTVHTLAETIEKRDSYTAGHTKRVMEYSLAIGAALALSKEDMTRLELSAVLHDVGKIGVRDDVLLKQSKLTAEEFASIKMHPVYGEEILSHVAQLRHIIPGVRGHHERYDGKGYPDGLKGAAIDMTARIIAVADSFDAMTSSRPYRQGLSLEEAFAELKKFSGSQFDPDVVKAFFSADVLDSFFTAAERKHIF
jgi:HD-GYP domain-containing protein (c-di-GMP phosphodiesterase class II)